MAAVIGRLKQLSALAFSGSLLRFTSSVKCKVRNVSRSERKHGSRGRRSQQKSFRAAGRFLVGGGVFLWDRERIYDWEIDECVARYERKDNDVHHSPPCKEDKEVSLDDTHASLKKCLRRQRRRKENMHLDNISEKIAQMREKVKSIMALTLRDGKGQFTAPLSRDFPPLVHRLFAYVLPPSSLFPSVTHRSSFALQSSPQSTSNDSCLLCQQFVRAKSAIHRKPRSSTDEVLMTSLHVALEQYTGQHKGEQACPSPTSSADLSQEEHSGEPSLVNGLSKASSQYVETGALSSPTDCTSPLQQASHRVPMLSCHNRHRRFCQLVSEIFSRYNKEFYALDHTHCTLSPEDYPTLDYRTGCHHRDLGIMSGTLQKWANDFAVSDGLSFCYSLGDFPCGEDLRTDMDSLGGSEHRSEVLSCTRAVSATSADDSYWDPYLQVPHVNLVNHCHISSLTNQLSSIASSNDFVPVVDASVFSDSFLVFNKVVPVARVQEGVLYELGSLTPGPQETEEVNRGIPEEAFFYMVTLPGASSSVAMTTVNGEAPWQLLLTNSSIKVYRRPFPGSSVFQYKVAGSCDDISAADFVDVQMDADVRLQWDSYLSAMEVVDRDPLTGTDLLHWVIKLPFPLKSRDYVFVRRLQVKRNGSLIVLINRSVTHPSCPETSHHVRVTDYFSEMVVEATNGSVKENGFRYELTYLDDPKCTIPSYIANWATTAGIPDFMSRAHNAAVERRRTLQGLQREVLHAD